MPTAIPVTVQIPRIEDEIEETWQEWQQIDEASMRDAFEAGFRAARTFKNMTRIGGA